MPNETLDSINVVVTGRTYSKVLKRQTPFRTPTHISLEQAIRLIKEIRNKRGVKVLFYHPEKEDGRKLLVPQPNVTQLTRWMGDSDEAVQVESAQSETISDNVDVKDVVVETPNEQSNEEVTDGVVSEQGTIKEERSETTNKTSKKKKKKESNDATDVIEKLASLTASAPEQFEGVSHENIVFLNDLIEDEPTHPIFKLLTRGKHANDLLDMSDEDMFDLLNQ